MLHKIVLTDQILSLIAPRHMVPLFSVFYLGLVVVCVILSINYWSASTRLADLQQQDDELRQTFRDELQLKKELQANNEMLESRVKKSQETHDNLRQVRCMLW